MYILQCTARVPVYIVQLYFILFLFVNCYDFKLTGLFANYFNLYFFVEVREGREPPAPPRPEDGGPHLQRGRHQLLLQRPGGVRPGPHRRCEQRRQRAGPLQLQLPDGRLPVERRLDGGVPGHGRHARGRRLDAEALLQI